MQTRTGLAMHMYQVHLMECHWFLPVEEESDFTPKKLEVTDRGGYPSSGDGPWFKAVFESLDFSVDGEPFVTNLYAYAVDGAGQSHIFWVTSPNTFLNLHWYKGGPRRPRRERTVTCSKSEYELQKEGSKWYLITRTYKAPDAVLDNRYGEDWGKAYLSEVAFPSNPTSTSRVRRDLQKAIYSDPVPFYRYNQYSAYLMATDIGVFGYSSAGKFEAAYTEAVQSLPKVESNLMANLAESVELLRSAFLALKEPGRMLEGIEKLSDPRNAWLAYRYQYTTTKLDVLEYKELLKRLQQISKFQMKDITCDGMFSDDTGSYHVQLKFKLSDILPKNITDKLSMLGLNFNASNIWDMVPYSFVVDWFLGISDVLKWFENWTYSFNFEPQDIWFTYKCSDINEETHTQGFYFYRVKGRPLSIPPVFKEVQVSQKTVRMRIADGISLFT